jgi:hypothetical protein
MAKKAHSKKGKKPCKNTKLERVYNGHLGIYVYELIYEGDNSSRREGEQAIPLNRDRQ